MILDENNEMVKRYTKNLLEEADMSPVNKRNQRILGNVRQRQDTTTKYTYPSGNDVLDILLKIKSKLNMHITFNDGSDGTLQHILTDGSDVGAQEALMRLGINLEKLGQTVDPDFYSKMMDILGL